SDHAQGQPSWLLIDGEKVEDDALTDSDTSTGYGSPYRKGHYDEGVHVIDLGQAREIKRMAYLSGDANWVFKVDISASDDGENFEPVEGMQGLDFHKKWGRQVIEVEKPFSARYLRLRYHNEGEKMDVVRTPVAFFVYDGTEDET